MEKITNAELMRFVDDDGSIFNLLKAWTIDFLEKIKPENSEDWAEAWKTHVLDAIYDGTRGDSPSAAMHKEKREELSPESQQFTESGYRKLEYNNFIRIISHNCRNRKIYDIYGIKRNQSDIIWGHVKSTKPKGNSSTVGPLRNYLEHDVKKNKGLNSEAADTDVKNLIDGLKSRENGFLRAFPYNASPDLHKHAYNVIKEVHKLWERLPAKEKGWDDWKPEEIIPAPAGLIPEPVPVPTQKIEQPVLIAERITSQSPQYLIFLVDESGSMGISAENNGHGSKGEHVVSAITDTLMALYSNQLRGNEGVKDYFYVSVLGYYGSTKGPIVEDLVVFDEDVEEAIKTAEIRTLTTIAEWGVEDNFIKFKAGGTTPMKEAFEKARDLIQFWHKNADEIVKQENPELTTSADTYHPPIILSISDGRYDDTEAGATLDKSKSPAKVIEEIQNTEYPKFYDKPVIMNIHISDKKEAEQVIFPDAIEDKKDGYLQEMFNLSSYLTDNMVAVGINQGFYPNISKNSKAFIYNAPLSELQKILLLGTSRTRTSITGLTSTPDDVGV